jgi:hypothetical protein
LALSGFGRGGVGAGSSLEWCRNRIATRRFSIFRVAGRRAAHVVLLIDEVQHRLAILDFERRLMVEAQNAVIAERVDGSDGDILVGCENRDEVRRRLSAASASPALSFVRRSSCRGYRTTDAVDLCHLAGGKARRLLVARNPRSDKGRLVAETRHHDGRTGRSRSPPGSADRRRSWQPLRLAGSFAGELAERIISGNRDQLDRKGLVVDG